MTMQNKILWVLQWLFGVYFVAVGVMHIVLPEGLPEPLSWMYDLDDTQHMLSGVAEILGGLALILPSLTRIAPWLTPLAAMGLMIVMIAAIFFHVDRDEIANVGINVFNLLVLGYIAWGRSRLVPIVAR